MNTATLSKLGWKLLNGDGCMWPPIMVAKYDRNRKGLEMLVPRAASSNVWQGFVSSVNIVSVDARKCVEDSRRTYFLLDKWMLSEPLITLVTQ